MDLSRGLLPVQAPDLGDESAREFIIPVEKIVEEGGQVADRDRSLLDATRHERAQTVAACVVLHPTGLKRRFLPVVGKDEQALPIRCMEHVLREHVDVRHCDRTDRTGRLAIAAAPRVPGSGARETRGEIAGVLLILADDEDRDERSGSPAGAACRRRIGMKSPAGTAEVDRHRARTRFVIVVGADHAIDQDSTAAAHLLIQAAPDEGCIHSLSTAGLLAGEGEVLEEVHEIVLPTGLASKNRKGDELFVLRPLDALLGGEGK